MIVSSHQVYKHMGTMVHLFTSGMNWGTHNLASWSSGTSTGNIVCYQTRYSNRRILSEQPLASDRVFVMLGRVGAGKTSLANKSLIRLNSIE